MLARDEGVPWPGRSPTGQPEGQVSRFRALGRPLGPSTLPGTDPSVKITGTCSQASLLGSLAGAGRAPH